MNSYAIGIDLGGTRIKGLAIDPEGKILRQVFIPTDGPEEQPWKSAIQRTVADLKTAVGNQPRVIGIAAPGITAADHRSISVMPGRLQGLEGFRWDEYLQSPVFVSNDAIAAMAAEMRFGEARGLQHAALLTLGTGVGGALLIHGRIYQGAFRKAGHLGHFSLDHRADPDICGIPGSLEDAMGNCTIEARSGGQYLSTQALLDDYRQGIPAAREIWLESVRKLAIALAGLDNILSPEKFILGGGIAEAGEDLFGPLQQYFLDYAWLPEGRGPVICKARFGDLAGAMGAACFALMQPGL